MSNGSHKVDINLGFHADTSQARREIENLQKTLNNLAIGKLEKKLPLTEEITEARAAAGQLEQTLKRAVNVDTGKLDLGKFSAELKRSNMNITQYANQLLQLGTCGSQAFNQMTQAIINAEVPLKRTNAALDKMWTTMKNTLRWQISASVLNGFNGAIQKAYGYAQDLDKSLNNIRIVTGYNADQMTAFATQANKAAQALSTTTNEYTKASLIYYQQGLSGSELEERTNITIKMANATGESAQKVSDQLTAVWNNFAKGGENLEYYADIMAKLGAETASSSDEISLGLEKFAAVAETVGLSYEYAASALATITATTRQSADVVGTALKTLFARMQDLELGETLDDGTTLGSYSEAMAKVGINIMDTNGKMKEMDVILEEMAAKWETLDKAQQTALAQNVAGVRQYTQLMALMNNWDFMEQNLESSYSASGYLQKQADIYAEGWEGARDRATAALEEIYNKLLDREFFTNITDVFTDFINIIAKVIDVLGGLPGVLSMISTVMLKAFGPQISQQIRDWSFNLSISTGSAKENLQKIKQELAETIKLPADEGSTEYLTLKHLQDELEINRLLGDIEDNLNAKERDTLQILLAQLKVRGELAVKAREAADISGSAENKAIINSNFAQQDYSDFANKQVVKYQIEISNLDKEIQQLETELASSERANKKHKNAKQKKNEFTLKQKIANLENQKSAANAKLSSAEKQSNLISDETYKDKTNDAAINANNQALFESIKQKSETAKEQNKGKKNKDTAKIFKDSLTQEEIELLGGKENLNSWKKVTEAINNQNNSITKTKQALLNYADSLDDGTEKGKKASAAFKTLIDAFDENAKAAKKSEDANNKYVDSNEKVVETIEGIKDNPMPDPPDFADSLVNTAQGISQLSSAFYSFKGAIDALNSEDLTFGEKFISIASSMSMGIVSLIQGYSQLSSGLVGLKAAIIGKIAALKLDNYTLGQSIVISIGKKVVDKAETNGIIAKTVALVAQKKAQDAANASTAIALTMGWIAIGAIVAISAAIIVVTAGIIHLFNEWKKNQPEAKLEAAKEKTEAMTEAANKATSAYKELNDTIADNQAAVDALKEMEKGTKEYAQALSDANDKQREFIEKNHLGKEDWYIDEDGVIQIDQVKVDELIQESKENAYGTALVAESAKKNESQAQYDVDVKNLKDEQASAAGGYFNTESDLNNAYFNVGPTSAVRTTMTDLFADTDLTPKQIDSKAFQYQQMVLNGEEITSESLAKNLLNKEETDLSELEKEMINLLQLYANDFYSFNGPEKYQNAINNYRSYEKEIQNSEEAKNNENNEGISDLTISGLLDEEEWFSESAYQNAVSQATAATADITKQEYLSGKKSITTVDGEEKAISEMNRKELDAYIADRMPDTYMLDQHGQLSYINEDGTIGEKVYDDDLSEKERQDMVANFATGDQIDDIALDFVNTLKNMSELENAAAMATVNGNFSNFSREELEQLNNMDQAQREAYAQDIANSYIGKELEALGYSTADEFKAAFLEAISNMDFESTLQQQRTDAISQGKKDVEDAGVDEEDIEAYEEYYKWIEKVTGLQDPKEIAKQTTAYLKQKKAIEDIADSWDDYEKALNSSDEETQDYLTEFSKLKEQLAEVFGLKPGDLDFITPEYLKEHKKDIENMLAGDEEAYNNFWNDLRTQNKNFSKEITNKKVLGIEWAINENGELDSKLASAANRLAEFEANNTITVGAEIDNSELNNVINEFIMAGLAAGETLTDITNQISEELGYNVKFKTPPGTTQQQYIATYKVEKQAEFDKDGNWTPPVMKPVIETAELNYGLPIIETITANGKVHGGNFIDNSTPPPSATIDSNGGGSGSSASKKDLRKATDEIERYHMITRSLDRLSRALEKVSTAKDRAFGKHRLNLIDQEIAATEDLITAQKQYLYQIEGHLAEDFAQLAQYGYTYDEYGEITNYLDVQHEQLAALNAEIAAYNAAVDSGNEAAIEAAAERVEAAEEAYEEFKDATDQYEETLTLLDEQQMQLQEYLNALVDLKLEKIVTEVEVKILVNDRELTKLEYLLKKLERAAKSTADEISNMSDQIQQVIEKSKPMQEAIDKIYEQARAEGRGLTEAEIAEIQAMWATAEAEGRTELNAEELARVNEIYEKAIAEDRMLTKMEEEQIQEYKEELLALNEQIWELQDSIEGKFLEDFEELNAEVEEGISRLDNYTSMLEHLNNALTLTGKANTIEGLNAVNALGAATVANTTRILKAQVENKDRLKEIENEIQNELANAQAIGDEHMIEYWEDNLEMIQVKIEESNVTILDAWNTALEAAGTLFDTKVNNMITKLKKNLGDIDTLVETYDRAKELEELYVSNNEVVYELSKLARDISKSIDDTSNILAKNKLVETLKEVNKLRAENTELTKYDLEYERARYELQLAEIALQEAQEAKSQVKLTRNNEGAWGYVYTADSQKIAEAEQNFEDATWNMQQLNAQYVSDYSDRLLENRQAFLEALANIDKNREDYDEEVMRVRNYYLQKEEYYFAELTKAYERSGVSYQETVLGQIYGDESLAASHELFKNGTIEMIENELLPAYYEWQNSVDNITQNIGTNLNDLVTDTVTGIENIGTAADGLYEKIMADQADMRDDMYKTMDAISEWQQQYLKTIDEMIAANEAYYDKTIADFTNVMEQIVDTTVYTLDIISDAAVGIAGGVDGSAQLNWANGTYAGSPANSNAGNYAKTGSLDLTSSSGNIGDAFNQFINWSKEQTSNDDDKATVYIGGFSKDAKSDREGNTIIFTENGSYSTQEGVWSTSYTKTREELIAEAKAAGMNVEYTESVFTGMNEDREKDGIAPIPDDYKGYNTTADDLKRLNTGGYTGEWGADGRLAILDEKELVLNKQDTSNMLDAVSLVRDMDMLFNSDKLMRLKNLERLITLPVQPPNPISTQEVKIEASFPSVTDHNEVEQALANLVNTASQYSNRFSFTK